MRSFVVVFLLLALVSVTAFRPMVRPVRTVTRRFDGPNDKLVPVQKETVENAAAVTGGVLGFALAGPIGALALAAISNYVSKKDNDAGVALRGFGKTVIESYNFLNSLNQKYDLTGKASETVKEAATKVAAENENLDQVTKTLDTTVTKVAEINKEFGLINKASQALVAAGTLTDAAFEKVRMSKGRPNDRWKEKTTLLCRSVSPLPPSLPFSLLYCTSTCRTSSRCLPASRRRSSTPSMTSLSRGRSS